MSAYNNLAIALAGQNRIAEAIEVLQTALQVDPANAQIQDNLAKVVELQKNTRRPNSK
jgi:Flp pilus assembly protein TadD